jgi:alpha-mannosidase II
VKWWADQDQSPEIRQQFKDLVKSGQLELTGGGLVMVDEALTTIFAIVENINEGRRWVEENIGPTPIDTSWQNVGVALAS